MLGNVTNIGEQAIRKDSESRWIVAGGRKCEVIMIDRKMAVTELRKESLSHWRQTAVFSLARAFYSCGCINPRGAQVQPVIL